MRFSLLHAGILVVATAVAASAQTKSTMQTIVNKECGFQIKIPTGWNVKPSSGKACIFTAVPDKGDGKLEIAVRTDTVENGEAELGFKIDAGKWTLQGSSDPIDAESIDGATFTGIQATRGGKESEGPGETRALLFDRKSRIAEIIAGNVDEGLAETLIEGFKFLPPPEAGTSPNKQPS